MSIETDRDFVEVLHQIVREAKELQQAGRLKDSVSRTEIRILEHELEVVQARLAATAVADGAGNRERAAAVAAWARALSAASAATRDHSRRLRKDLYRTRIISGSGPH